MSKRQNVIPLGVAIAQAPLPSGPYLFAGDLLAGSKAVADMGYKGVELSLVDSRRLDRAAVAATVRNLGLRVFAIATGLSSTLEGISLFAESAERRRAAVERMMGHIDFAGDLSCPVIIGGIRGRINSASPSATDVVHAGMSAVAECLAHARRAGVAMLLEPINRYESNIVNTAAEGARMIHELGDSSVKLLLDTFHMNIEEQSAEASIAAAGHAIGYLHFADSNRHAPGWGHLNFSSVLHALERAGVRVDITIEALPIPSGAAAAKQALEYITRLSLKS
jgi:sugar phosphate isomerase/epimerase